MKRTIQQYIDDEYAEGSKPHPTTVVRRIQRGQLNGIKEGGTWYVVDYPVTNDDRANEILRRRYGSAA